MFIMQALASQLHFLANRNAELAVPPLFCRPVNCIKIGGHVALLSCPSIYFLFYGAGPQFSCAGIPTLAHIYIYIYISSAIRIKN